MKFNKENVLKLVEEGYLLMNKHPERELYTINYSQKVQFENYWNEITLMCRGLIVDGEFNIVARPWAKFHNIEQHDPSEIPNLPFEVYDKEDGSLGILFKYNGDWMMATRGSFVSDQAIKGFNIFKTITDDHHYFLNENCTYLFEIIYPENRIVKNYHGKEDLILLGVIVTSTGEEIPYDTMESLYLDYFTIVKRYDGINDFTKIRDEIDGENKEGFIIKFSNGFRVKMKYEEYCRLHRIITNVSARHVWEYLKDNKSFDELLEKVPDEFYDWVKKTVKELNGKYTEIEVDALRTFKDIIFELSDTSFDKKFYTKKEFAMKAKEYPYSGLLFAMYDNKDYRQSIWKLLKPEFSKPFMDDESADE